MKKALITGLASTIFSALAAAEGVVGNNLSVELGVPFYPDLELDYASVAYDVSGAIFVSKAIYLHGGLHGEYVGIELDGLTYTVTTSGYGGGLGGEFPITSDYAVADVAVFAQGGYYFKKQILGVTDGVDTIEDPAFNYKTYTGEAGFRRHADKSFSKLSFLYTGYVVDSENVDSDLEITGSLGVEMGDSFILSFDGSVDLEFERYYFGLGGTWRL